MDKEKGKKMLPTLAFSTLMLMTFGNLGTSMAFALQSSNDGICFTKLKYGSYFSDPRCRPY